MAEYIDRLELIGIEKLLDTPALRSYEAASYIYDQMMYDIEQIPAADVAPVKHGKWIWDTREVYPKPMCSRCGMEPWRKSNRTKDLPNFCPNCGAKMDWED